MTTINLRIADWSRTPGPRYIMQGPCSAEQYWLDVLDDAAKAVMGSPNGKITIDLDGVAGYGASFLEEIFGGLSRRYSKEEVARRLTILCTEDPFTLKDAWEYARNPRPPKRPMK